MHNYSIQPAVQFSNQIKFELARKMRAPYIKTNMPLADQKIFDISYLEITVVLQIASKKAHTSYNARKKSHWLFLKNLWIHGKFDKLLEHTSKL